MNNNMNNNMNHNTEKKIAFNPDLSKKEKEQILGLVESFHNNTPWINYDILLKTILFSLVFYLIASDMINLILTKYLPKYIDKILIQSLLFGFVFYLINNQI